MGKANSRAMKLKKRKEVASAKKELVKSRQDAWVKYESGEVELSHVRKLYTEKQWEKACKEKGVAE